MHRREFGRKAALLTAGAFVQAGQSIRAYIGSYSSPQGPEGSKGRGGGIYLFEMDTTTGALTQKTLFQDGANPSWLAWGPGRKHMYVAEEGADGAVSAVTVNPISGELSKLNRVSSGGAGPAHLSVHPSGQFVLVANYAGGSVAVLPIEGDGSLRSASDIIHHEGTVGPAHAASAPPGSFAISGHERPHAHMIQADASGKFVFAADLGLDKILIYKFDAKAGKLTPNDPPSFDLPPGDGPRHFTFHPNGRWFYALQEEASTLITCDYDSLHGSLKAKQSISTLPKGFAGTNFTSEIAISPDLHFVYVANRLHDSIAWFRIGSDGTLTLTGEEWTRGDYPRSFTIDPTGGFVYCCNQRADAVVCFRRNAQSGALTFTGQYTPVGTPAIVLFA